MKFIRDIIGEKRQNAEGGAMPFEHDYGSGAAPSAREEARPAPLKLDPASRVLTRDAALDGDEADRQADALAGYAGFFDTGAEDDAQGETRRAGFEEETEALDSTEDSIRMALSGTMADEAGEAVTDDTWSAKEIDNLWQEDAADEDSTARQFETLDAEEEADEGLHAVLSAMRSREAEPDRREEDPAEAAPASTTAPVTPETPEAEAWQEDAAADESQDPSLAPEAEGVTQSHEPQPQPEPEATEEEAPGAEDVPPATEAQAVAADPPKSEEREAPAEAAFAPEATETPVTAAPVEAARDPQPEATPSAPVDVTAPALGRAAGRAGRVKTRLLGFNGGQTPGLDPLAAERESPEALDTRFPVGWLVVVKGPGRGEAFTLQTGVAQIGRGAGQQVRLDFGDNSISRENHAAIAYDSEQKAFFIGHGGKANLVRRNGRPVLSTEELQAGDLIVIGETTLRFAPLCGPEFGWDEGQDSGQAYASRA